LVQIPGGGVVGWKTTGERMTDQGAKYARKLALLQKRFPHPEGRPWRGSEMEERTRGFVSQSYFSQLGKGKYKRPGLEPLAAIADVMGFPFELWRAEPEQWPRILREREPEGRRVARGTALAEKFEILSEAVPNPRTNEPFTDEEIVERSGGRLTDEDLTKVRAGRAGELTYDKILALSDVFDVSFDYWFEDAGGEKPLLDPEIIEALKSEENHLLLHRTRGLSKAHRNMLLLLAEQLDALEKTGEENGR
jgi:transcriptional regulator with XRE-family HTH domain